MTTYRNSYRNLVAMMPLLQERTRGRQQAALAELMASGRSLLSHPVPRIPVKPPTIVPNWLRAQGVVVTVA